MNLALVALDERDLALAGASRAEVSRKAIVAAVTATVLLGTAMAFVGLADGLGGTLAVASVSIMLGFVAFRGTLARISAVARRKRSEFDLSVAVLLDLVNIQMAGGAGLETSLLSAASLGDSWAFGAIRTALTNAQAARRSYWDALIELGGRWGITSLTEMAHAARLSGEHGSRVRQSLVSKSSSLRARNLAAKEFEAQQRTEQMGLPMVLLFLSFLLFVGYPAMSQTMGSL